MAAITASTAETRPSGMTENLLLSPRRNFGAGAGSLISRERKFGPLEAAATLRAAVFAHSQGVKSAFTPRFTLDSVASRPSAFSKQRIYVPHPSARQSRPRAVPAASARRTSSQPPRLPTEKKPKSASATARRLPSTPCGCNAHVADGGRGLTRASQRFDRRFGDEALSGTGTIGCVGIRCVCARVYDRVLEGSAVRRRQTCRGCLDACV